MKRKSCRLVKSGYYTEQGIPTVSYKEVVYRVFSRRRATPHSKHNANSSVDVVAQNHVGSNAPETPNTATRATSDASQQTNRCIVCHARKECLFKVLLVLITGLIYMHVQLKETQMEVHALRQRIDLFVSQTDTIPNFALESLGAKVCHSLSSDTYWPYDIGLWERIFHRSHSSKKQRQVIQGQTVLQPGQCWCFSGTSGHLLISLSHLVSITHVTLGHITKGRSPSGCIMSAPKEFSVFGMMTTTEEGSYLGRWTFSQNGPEFQTFKLLNPNNGVFFYVKLQVENNWGNTNYTCLYSFRVHGHLPL